ncbi:hypothetical protein BpHYR1_020916 [Brachionus plicatilis]|uniref:Uncharacterized protein n=1 Tax=Brachionus plicatilis TaxID=10195 RepID=A0A3M7P318_BRAPC|nr:hypothetical protein BpHYR1_020916 [Brachionus plicatilis]
MAALNKQSKIFDQISSAQPCSNIIRCAIKFHCIFRNYNPFSKILPILVHLSKRKSKNNNTFLCLLIEKMRNLNLK